MRIRVSWVCTISLLHVIFACFPAHAFLSRGVINARYSYEQLKLERDDKGNCYLKGSIVNRTDSRRENVRFTVYAMSLHGRVLWKVRVKADLIDKFESFPFVKKIKRCINKTPYKWEFKVADRNR